MNFLAHAYFAQGDAERIVGQFCGDFVRGSDLSSFSVGIQRGIRLHRQIDAFTDRHPAVLGVRPLFKPPFRRLAGVVTDVVYDHMLALNWANYSDQGFDQFVEQVHEALLTHKNEVPENLQRFIDFLIEKRVLQSNRNFSGVAITLNRLSKRSEAFAPLAQSPVVAQANFAALQASFDAFFPDLQAHVNDLNDLASRAQ